VISAAEALSLVLRHAHPLASEETAVRHAAGRVLAEDVTADRDHPPFDRSVMDGFAVRLSHAGRAVAIRGEARPGHAPTAVPDDDACVEIMTGSPCPPGTQAVVMKEEVRTEAGFASFPEVIALGQNIVPRGSERLLGDVVLPSGAVLSPIALALLAAVGRTKVCTRRLPSIALLRTGDELAVDDRAPGDGEIRDSNGPMLEAMARGLGITLLTSRVVKDTPEALALALDASHQADVVVLTGGVSAGNYDLVPGALLAHGANIVFHKVSQQPGKPILFATLDARLAFGLPGTPLGCHLGFHRYVSQAVRAMAGLSPAPEETGTMSASWSTRSERQQFVLARVTQRSGAWSVTPRAARGSSDLFTPWDANAYLNVPEGTRALRLGQEVRFEWLHDAG
jgi:molybdopterin molybdotransferase